MAWHMFRVIYELRSPLHIGYRKVGNVQRTRYYIPARNLWAAVTERLTRSGFHTTDVMQGDYQGIGEWVKQHCAFSYFFLCDNSGDLLYPQYTEQGLCYGSLSEAEFERRFLSAHVTTALDAATTSAAEGSLHEVEFIGPHDSNGQRASVCGWVFVDELGLQHLGDGKWSEWLSELQVGGERRYGFGRLRLISRPEAVASLEHCQVKLSGERPQVQVDENQPVWAHTLVEGVKGRGMIEPLVGRETRADSCSFGRALTRAQVCWVPGSMVEQMEWLTLDGSGVWCK